MRYRPVPVILIALAVFAVEGCGGHNPSAGDTTRSGTGTISRGAVQEPVTAGAFAQPNFDYYLLNLSWSPEFCRTHPTNPQCGARPGFVVHGLWPQNNDGSYPENCPGMARPPHDAAYLDLMPTVSLIRHEWQTHGTCTGLNPDAYFAEVRSAFRKVAIPSMFASTQTPPKSVAPEELLQALEEANPSFPNGAFAVTCGNNEFTAIEACFDKHLNPIACKGVHSCRTKAIKIAPR